MGSTQTEPRLACHGHPSKDWLGMLCVVPTDGETANMKKQYVVYTRVSTEDQGRSGLGKEAQERDINIYLTSYSEIPWEIAGTFHDTLSGKIDNRPELTKALAMARETGAELLVAKLDRLSRDVAFIATLLKDKRVAFRVASMPQRTSSSSYLRGPRGAGARFHLEADDRCTQSSQGARQEARRVAARNLGASCGDQGQGSDRRGKGDEGHSPLKGRGAEPQPDRGIPQRQRDRHVERRQVDGQAG